jgi:hypothetical protein
MYRGSSFLLRHDYTVHIPIVERLASDDFRLLRNFEVGATPPEPLLAESLLTLVNELKRAYAPFRLRKTKNDTMDILATKVIRGTLGSLPECDRYFIAGFRASGRNYSRVNEKFVRRILQFCEDRLPELRRKQSSIETRAGLRYPLMKLVDMYIWQTGYQADRGKLEFV